MRGKNLKEAGFEELPETVGLSQNQVEEMYRYLAIADYHDRFVIPTSHAEYAYDAFSQRSACGFSDAEGCNLPVTDNKKKNLFGGL